MINVKIDVLSGLHAGASWVFNNGEISVGGNPQCSVFLCDQDLPDFCVRLKVIGNRVLLREVNPALVGADELVGREGKWVYPDQVFAIESQGVKFNLSIVDSSAVIWARLGNFACKSLSSSAELIQGMGVKLVLGISFCMGLVSTVTVLFLGTVGANNLEAREREAAMENKGLVISKPHKVIDSVREELVRFSETRKVSYTSLEVKDDSVRVVADMNRVQMRDFENMLKNLARDYGKTVSISAQLALSQEQKLVDEIDVRSVSYGSQPVVMLRGGERLFLDSVYNNLRLVEVSTNKIVLVGQSSRYELAI